LDSTARAGHILGAEVPGQALLAMVLPAFSANSASLRFIAFPLP
jgi:hypothetical protein